MILFMQSQICNGGWRRNTTNAGYNFKARNAEERRIALTLNIQQDVELYLNRFYFFYIQIYLNNKFKYI